MEAEDLSRELTPFSVPERPIACEVSPMTGGDAIADFERAVTGPIGESPVADSYLSTETSDSAAIKDDSIVGMSPVQTRYTIHLAYGPSHLHL